MEHHLSFSMLQCCLVAHLAPLLTEEEKAQQSMIVTVLLYPPNSVLENREQYEDCGT